MEKLTEKQKDLLKNCRYYNGEKECPYAVYPNNWFWDMERVYVTSDGVAGGEASYYYRVSGKSYPGISNNLVTVMFTSWGKTAFDIKSTISKFYALIEDYLEIASDHYKKDKLPSEGAKD